MNSTATVLLRASLVLILLAALSFSIRAPAADEPPAAAAHPLAGIWQGALNVGAVELRLVLKIAEEDGELTGKIDSPDQGVKDIAVDTVALDEKAVRVELKALAASFEGELSDDGQQIAGHWKQSGLALPLTVKRLEKEPDYSRPQEPKKPYPYAEEEVTYENSQAGVKLAGTLTLPQAEQPVPAVLLITGSGPQDRDESLLGHKPFLVLADYLTRRGIAVLRVDDRGVGGSTGDPATSTTDDFAGDALAGVAYLKSRQEIDPAKIGLIGHSEGGLIAPLAASRSSDVAFIVMLAGTGVRGEEILYRQAELITRASGASDEQVATAGEQQRQLFEVLRQEPDPAAAEVKLREIVAQLVEEAAAKPDQAADQAPAETIKAQAEAQVKALVSPWFRFFLTYDPRLALSKVTCPVLAINGEKDLQVDPKQNLPPIEEALKAGGNKDYTIRELAGLNHLFQTCQSGAPAEYGKIDETFAPAALELIADWILERF